MINNRSVTQLIFWGVWLVIPLIWEILGSVAAAVLILLHKLKQSGSKKTDRSQCDPSFFPLVSIIIPVYNSENSLEKCLQSILEQSYPMERMEVLLVDNGSTDRSRDVFVRFQEDHTELKVWWRSSEQGKSRALNMGVFSGSGRYIVNIDSDGALDRNAILNIVNKFESNPDISAMTGIVLTDYRMIEDKSVQDKKSGCSIFLKLVRRCELFEYCESFLVGRRFESMYDHLHTMAGAFSCFRREALMKTQLYNTETIGEDAHMTNQVRNLNGGKVVLCENAFYFTEPVESFNKLYVQRQRWQRAELEVAAMFLKTHSGGFISFIKKPDMRRLVSSHTLAFPRLIWMFAMIYLYFINYPLKLLIGANLLLYVSYVLLSVINIAVACLFLQGQQLTRRYITRHMQISLIIPLYRIIIYWVRIAGIINSLTTPSRWRMRTLSEEISDVRQGAAEVAHKRFRLIYRLREIINSNEKQQ